MKQNEHDWQHWMDRLSDPDVTEQEIREFQEILNESPDQRDAYLDALLAETALELQGGLLVAQPESTLPEETSTVREARPVSAVSVFRRSLPWVAAAAAVLIAVPVTNSLLHRPAPETASPTPHLATITDTNKMADAHGFRIGAPLHRGEIHLPEGVEIGIAMRGGARLEINGPAHFRIDNPEAVHLTKGRIQTYAPEYARGFIIDTEDGKIVDLGTRFVTANGTDAGTEVHVIEGLVKARPDGQQEETFLSGEQAGILKNGAMVDTEYLAKRLQVPLNPVLNDRDEDGFADVIEEHYRTNANDPRSAPAPLRISEPFDGYAAKAIQKTAYLGRGKITHWKGGGTFLHDGLHYSNNGKKLHTSGGCLQTTGENGTGAFISPDALELPKQGTIYISFLMQQPAKKLDRAFSGLLLYLGDHKEQLFTGELSIADSYGSRYAESPQEDPFAIKSDQNAHLFVIRIDQTRFLTDVFIDPKLGTAEATHTPHKRYQDSPKFERIAVRSGSDSGTFPVKFDEIRIGLTWESVLPIAE